MKKRCGFKNKTCDIFYNKSTIDPIYNSIINKTSLCVSWDSGDYKLDGYSTKKWMVIRQKSG